MYSVSGTVSLANIAAGHKNQPLNFVFAYPDPDPNHSGSTLFFTRQTSLDTNGNFTLSGLPARSYTLWVKGYKWLAKTAAVDTTNGNVTGLTLTLLPCDANSDNAVDLSDFGVLVDAFDSSITIPGSGYDDHADFNCDGSVDLTDFGLLVNGFGSVGASFPVSGLLWRHSIIWDLPAPDYGAGTVPMDGAGSGGMVNLTSGVYENHPGADIAAFNPVGPSPAYVRTYHSGRASQKYGSPGLSAGWIDNYDYRLVALSANGTYGPLMLVYPNGAFDLLTPGPVQNGVCTFSAPAKVPYAVTGVAGSTAGLWQSIALTFANNRQMVFTPGAAPGVYWYTQQVDTKLVDGAGNALRGHMLSIQRGNDGRISSISNDDTQTGQASGVPLLQFTYTGAGSSAALDKVTDVQGARFVQYGYTGGELTSVSQISTPNALASSQWAYNYGTVNTWTLLTGVSVPDPASVNHPLLATSTIGYEAAGRVQTVTDSQGRWHSYRYHSDGAAGTSTDVAVQSNDPMLGVQTTEQWTQKWAGNRDAGFHQQYDNADGSVDNDGNPNQVVLDTTIAYKDLLNPYLVTAVTDQNGQESDYTYDDAGNVLTVTEPVSGNRVVTQFTWLPQNDPLALLSRIDTTSLDANGNVTAAKTPITFDYYAGTVSDMSGIYGLKGLISAINTPTPGQVGLSTPLNQVTTSFRYTPLGNIAQVSVPAVNSGVGTEDTFFAYTQDNYPLPGVQNVPEALGEPLAVTSPFQASVGAATGTRTTHYRYDRRGNLSASFSPMGEETDYLYDAADALRYAVLPKRTNHAGRAVSETHYQYLGGPADWSAFYDESNSHPADNPPHGDTIRQTGASYGSEEELKSVSGSTAPVTLSYDAAYRLSGLADATASAHSKKSAFAYDGGGSLIRHTWPGGKSVSMTYDSKGNLAASVSARGTAVTPHYLSADHARPDSLTFSAVTAGAPVLPGIAYTYDAFGRVRQISDSGTTISYTYDDLDHLMSETTHYGPPPPPGQTAIIVPSAPPATPGDQESAFTYNTDGTLKQKIAAWVDSIGHPCPTVWDFDYSEGCISPKVTLRQVCDPVHPYQVGSTPTFDTDGHTIKEILAEQANVLEVDAIPDDQCLTASLTNLDASNNNVPLSAFTSLDHDALGLLRSFAATYPHYAGGAGATTVTTNYGYDDGNQRDRLLDETHTINPMTPGDDFSANFTPDAGDNIASPRSVNNNVNAGYNFNEDNQISNAGFSYDDDGNLTVMPGVTMTYDAANRLIAYTYTPPGTAVSKTLTFGYRPDGLRAWKSIDGGVTKTYYFYTGTRLAYEMQYVTANGSGAWQTTRTFAYGAKGLFASWTPSEGVIEYAFDVQGNVVSRHTAGAGWQDARVYDAYGQLRRHDGLAGGQDDPVGWNGQSGYYTDLPSMEGTGGQAGQQGLVLCTFRCYSPELCRWLTRDSLGYEGGLNVYAYCGNNPVCRKDPSGLATDPGGDDNTVRIVLDAFIPDNQIEDPFGNSFNGDGRGVNSSGGTFRIEQQIIINIKTGTVTFKNQTGVTSGVFMWNSFEAKASTDGLTGSVGCANGIGKEMGTTDIILSGSIGNPAYHGTAPPISYHIVITVDNLTGTVVRVSGTRTDYPAFEIYQYFGTGKHTTVQTIYQYDPRPKGRDAKSLFVHNKFWRSFR